jgi:hypothetical protein
MPELGSASATGEDGAASGGSSSWQGTSCALLHEVASDQHRALWLAGNCAHAHEENHERRRIADFSVALMADFAQPATAILSTMRHLDLDMSLINKRESRRDGRRGSPLMILVEGGLVTAEHVRIGHVVRCHRPRRGNARDQGASKAQREAGAQEVGSRLTRCGGKPAGSREHARHRKLRSSNLHPDGANDRPCPCQTACISSDKE